MQKVKVDSPIPGLEKHFPKGSKLERGGGAGGMSEKVPPVPTGTAPSMSEKEPPVSVVQLAKRVAADQLGMCVGQSPVPSAPGSCLHAGWR